MRTVMARLEVGAEQGLILLRTIEAMNRASAAIAEVAFRERATRRTHLHHLTYHVSRERFGLSAQMAVRAIGKVGGAYVRDPSRKPTFRLRGAVPYDPRIRSWKGERRERVSLLTLDGRQEFRGTLVRVRPPGRGTGTTSRRGRPRLPRWGVLPCPGRGDEGPETLRADGCAGSRYRRCEPRRRLGRRDLQVGRGRSSARPYGPPPRRPPVRGHREREAPLEDARPPRSQLSPGDQSPDSPKKSSRGPKARRARLPSKTSGIRERTTVRHSQRRRHLSWSFRQLRAFMEYKAAARGVPADPRGPPEHLSHVSLLRDRRQEEPTDEVRVPMRVVRPRWAGRPHRRGQHRGEGRSRPAHRGEE